MNLKEFKTIIDKQITIFIEKKYSAYSNSSYDEIDLIFNHLKNFISEGKRLRSYLAYLAYISNGGKKDNEAIELFTFIEIFHAFCLVHDDIMDKSDMRHGIKTIHKYITDNLNQNSFVESMHYGNSQAMLAGDLLFSWAYEILLSKKVFDQNSLNRVQKVFTEMIDEVVMGQMIDFGISNMEKVSDEKIYEKIKLKTAGYTFIKPLLIGASLSKDNINPEFYSKLGLHLGIAFQIQDDLMDLKFEESSTHKTSFSDMTAHQHTLFSNYILKNGSKKEKAYLEKCFGKKLNLNEKQNLRKIFNNCGAFIYGENLIEKNLNSATKILNQSKMEYEYKKKFLSLIEKIRGRQN